MSTVTTSAKTIAVISHLTLLGWVTAIVMNSKDKTEFGSFYIRQTLILNLILSVGLFSFLGKLVALIALVFIVISLLNALTGIRKELPMVGEYFQNWFSSL